MSHLLGFSFREEGWARNPLPPSFRLWASSTQASESMFQITALKVRGGGFSPQFSQEFMGPSAHTLRISVNVPVLVQGEVQGHLPQDCLEKRVDNTLRKQHGLGLEAVSAHRVLAQKANSVLFLGNQCQSQWGWQPRSGVSGRRQRVSGGPFSSLHSCSSRVCSQVER